MIPAEASAFAMQYRFRQRPERAACRRRPPPMTEDLAWSCCGLSRDRFGNASGSRSGRCSRKAQSAVRAVLRAAYPRQGCPRKTKSPAAVAGLFKSETVPIAYLGAEASAPVAAFVCFLLWECFLAWVLAGADADVSDAGAVVSAANTGPASRSRLTT